MVKYLAVDNAANAEAVKSFQVNIDKIAPAANCGSASANWLGTDASIACSPTDGGGSGLASSVAATFNLSTSVAAGTENANASTDSRTIFDAVGNSNAGINSSPYKIDLSDPTNVQFSGGPAAGSSYDFGSVPAAPTCTADDAISGLKDCVVTGYSNAVGTHTLTAKATDNAGRTTTETRTYTVSAYRLSGFYQPVDMRILNGVKAGSTVPMKFELFQSISGTELTSTSAISKTSFVKLNCASGTTEDAIEEYATGGTSLRYDSTGGQFIYNWQAPKAAVGTCYRVTIIPNDGSTNALVADFRIR